MKAGVAVVCVVAILGTPAASAQQKSAPQQPAAVPQDEPYQPGLGEIMALQQMRHIKLWFAGHAGNWPLAAYEIGELQEGFDDVRQLLGGDIVEQHVGAALAALQRAIDGKDSAAFDRPPSISLSAGCNACHMRSTTASS